MWLSHNANYKSSLPFHTEIGICELFEGWIHISFAIFESLTPRKGLASGRRVCWMTSIASFCFESWGCQKCWCCHISVIWFSRLWKPVCMFRDSGALPGLHTGWNHLGSFLKKLWWIQHPEILINWPGMELGNQDVLKGPQMFVICTTVEKYNLHQITTIIGK